MNDKRRTSGDQSTVDEHGSQPISCHGSADQAREATVPKTTDSPADTGAGRPAELASKIKVSDSVTHEGTSGPGQGQPVPKTTDIPEPVPKPKTAGHNEGIGPAPLGS